jgi:hypothetical protein
MKTYRLNSKPKHATIHTRWQTRVKVCRAISWNSLRLPRKRYVAMEIKVKVQITPCKVSCENMSLIADRSARLPFISHYVHFLTYGKVLY